MFTQEQSTFLNLIKVSLWGGKSPENADIAFNEAKKHALVPLLFPNSAEAMRYSVHCIRILYAQDMLRELLNSAGIPMVILKGTAASIYYPEPFLRTMGDIDFIVPADRFQEASALLTENGYSVAHEEHKLDRHIAYLKDDISLEMHIRFSSESIDIERYVLDGMQYPVTVQIEDHSFEMLPPLANGMVLLAHVAQHLRYDLGMRQVIDWMMFVDRVLTDEMWGTEFQMAARSCGLETLALAMTRMCQMFLGLSDSIMWCKDADSALAEAILSIVLETGNFGHQHGPGSSIEKVSTGIQRFGLFRYLQIAGENNWNAYHRHHWLKPFCWLYQIFRYAKQGLHSNRSKTQFALDYTRSRSRYDLLTRLGID